MKGAWVPKYPGASNVAESEAPVTQIESIQKN